jgi:WD40 repeat protein
MPGGHVRSVLSVAFSPDNTTLASAGEDNMIKLWNVQGRRLLDSLSDTRTPSQGLAFSPDGAKLASSGADERVRLWDVKERRRLGEPLETGGRVEGVAFLPRADVASSPMLAAAASDPTGASSTSGARGRGRAKRNTTSKRSAVGSAASLARPEPESAAAESGNEIRHFRARRTSAGIDQPMMRRE